jgi:hypothetical protein
MLSELGHLRLCPTSCMASLLDNSPPDGSTDWSFHRYVHRTDKVASLLSCSITSPARVAYRDASHRRRCYSYDDDDDDDDDDGDDPASSKQRSPAE